jgi:hypothetical protein
MFSNGRRRFRNRIIGGCLGALVLASGVWMNYKTIVSDEGITETIESVEQQVAEGASTDTDQSSDLKEADGTAADSSTYTVRNVDGVVKVFVAEDGEEKLFLITSIPYELLAREDQKLFDEGVAIDTEDELYQFLENFDS